MKNKNTLKEKKKDSLKKELEAKKNDIKWKNLWDQYEEDQYEHDD